MTLLALLLASTVMVGGAPVMVGGAPSESVRDSIPTEMVQPSDVPGIQESQVLIPDNPMLQDRLRVVYWPGHEGRAQRVIETLEARPHLPGLPAAYPRVGVVFLAPDQARWEALTGGRAPHWGAGVAIPARSRIIMPVFQTPWDGFQAEGRTLRHEWAHLGLHDYLEGLLIPRWFDEGYAQWASGTWNMQEAWRLRFILAGDRAPPLDSLTLQWPRGRGEAEVAYLLSATAVQFMVRDSGARGMEVLLSRWREEGDFEAAFRRTFGITTSTFEGRWLEHVQRRYGFLFILGQSAVFWLLLGVVVLVLFRIRRRRDQERMEELRATEPPELPAYWNPPRSPPIGGFPEDVRRQRSRRGRSVDPGGDSG